MQSAGFDRRGALLVLGSATAWSFGGTIARYLSVTESWTIVFWRAFFASVFLLWFMLHRQGLRGTLQLFRAMGWAGVAVGACFALASTCFVVALSYTTVANILLIQAGVPLIAALMAFLLFGERVPLNTWVAIAAVITGVGIMVSESLGGTVSPIGDGLAVLIALAFSGATVITRRHAEVQMMPAVCTGTLMATCVAAAMTPAFAVSPIDLGLLFMFGAFNLGLGMAFFVTGAPLLPSAIAALIGIAEPVLGPLWVWLIHNEIPSHRTLIGGAVVFFALLGHILWQLRQSRAEAQAD
jgi:drug/metabolite transporter (DMT)-like permease